MRVSETTHYKKEVFVLMGRLSKYFDIPVEKWEKAMEESVPEKFLELNKKAFMLGRGKG